MKKRIKYRKRRATRVFVFNPWNFDAEPGDLMVDTKGRLFRLRVCSGRRAHDAGELSYVEVKPPSPEYIAEITRHGIDWVLRDH